MTGDFHLHSADNNPVVIAGAGPVGCLLALYLAGRDIPVLLLELKEMREMRNPSLGNLA